MTNHSHSKLASYKVFVNRLIKNVVFSLVALLFSLLIGIVGYMYYEKLSFIDAYANAAMILSGVGATTGPQTVGGKLFVGSYALFSGIIFLLIAGFLLTPIVHRFFHKFHLEDSGDAKK